MELSPQERAVLHDLVDQLVEVTDNNTYWLGQVREIALELRARLDSWLTNDGFPPRPH